MLLEVVDVSVSFKKEKQSRLWGKERQQVLQNISVSIAHGDVLGIVGESGSGKSTFGKVVLGMLRPQEGIVRLEGKVVTDGNQQGKMSLVFQDYKASVNPKFTVKQIIEEPLLIKPFSTLNALEREEKIQGLLQEVGLSVEFSERYPHQLSGGQIQRICIARAIATNPKIIVFDEATSSLDMKTKLNILDLLIDLKLKYGLSYIFISHDLEAVNYLCNKVVLINQGKVESQHEKIKTF
ncbi:MAG: ABC transporter ATP-binding protein [Alkaliphilus sp.]|nr:ABC transporter ATP-binding protein [Alkaliphilus sp.]